MSGYFLFIPRHNQSREVINQATHTLTREVSLNSEAKSNFDTSVGQEQDVECANGRTKTNEIRLNSSSEKFCESNRKYEIFLKKIVEGNNPPTWMRLGPNLEINQDIIDFFNVNEETKLEFVSTIEKYKNLVKTWEVANRKKLESSNDGLSYKIYADPDFSARMSEDFMADIYSLLGGEGADLLRGSAEQFFDDLKLERKVKFSVSDLNENVWEYKYKVERLDKNGDVKASFGSNDFVKKDGSSGVPPVIPSRYDHFFGLE